MNRVLLDTGPLVALASPRDPHHDACRAQFAALRPPLLTTWPILTEAAWLLRQEADSLRKLFALGETGMYVLDELGQSALPWLHGFLRRYGRARPDLADATLVFLAERENIDTVFTLDRRDFSIYRFGRNRTFRILPE